MGAAPNLAGSGGSLKLLSSNPRALAKVTTDPGQVVPGGLSLLQFIVPVMVLQPFAGAPVPPKTAYPIPGNWRMKFSGGVALTTAGAADVSLESASMLLRAFNGIGTVLAEKVNAARLSSTTALAQNVGVSFDDWLVDHNDLLTLAPGALFYQIILQLVVNNTGGIKAYTLTGSVQLDALQFSNYHFSEPF